MQKLQEQISPESKSEIITKIIKDYKLSFPCPHCREEINDDHFDQGQKSFNYLNECLRRIVEDHFASYENNYQEKWLKDIEIKRIYEKFLPVQELKKIIEEQKKEIGFLKSSEYVEQLKRVQNLTEENKELRNQLQLLQIRDRSSKRKGEDFELWIFEELNRVFDNKDKISKITQIGKKADFCQEILTENEPKKMAGKIIYEAKDTDKWDDKWINKLESDMAHFKADYGIIIATCENGKPLRCLDPRKKIYISDENNFIYIAKIMRDALIQKSHLLEMVNTDSKEKRIKNFEEWTSNRLPQFLSRLEKELIELNKSANNISRAAENLKGLENNIHKIVFEEMRTEINNL